MTQESSNDVLPGFWYAAASSDQIRSGNMVRVKMLGRPLLLVRDSEGSVHALDDHCPHRGIPLSDGKFDGKLIECCYHGWKFSCAGTCVEIPSLAADSPVKASRIKVRKYDCEDRDGLIWVYHAGLGVTDAPPVPTLPKFSENYSQQVFWRSMKCDLDHGIIGLMDPAHGPFVHQSWWWRSRKSIHEKEKRFEPIELGFRMSEHEPSPNSAAYKLLKIYNKPVTTMIDFVLPNRRIELIRCGSYWYSSQAVVTPIDKGETRLYFSVAWNVFRGVPFIKLLQKFFADRFIGQDREIMEKQAVGLGDDPSIMLIDGADTPAKWYFQLKAAYLRSLEEGTEFEHPVKEPTVLRWRS